MCFHYLDDKKSISKLHNSTILHSAVKVWPPRTVTLQKYFFSLVQLMPYKYGFRGYVHFFCTIANKNTATTYVRTGGLCYKTREICHGDDASLSTLSVGWRGPAGSVWVLWPLFGRISPLRQRQDWWHDGDRGTASQCNIVISSALSYSCLEMLLTPGIITLEN